MKIIYNNYLPFKNFTGANFKCFNFFGLLFVRRYEDSPLTEVDINHEAIHTAQMRELLYIGFYICYFAEWAAELLKFGKNSYDNNSFEEEAYAHEKDFDYLKTRKRFAQWRK